MKRILLHICCAPCATTGVERLLDAGRPVTLWFSNSNLDSEAEFERRLAAARQLAAHFDLPLETEAYDHADWLACAAAHAAAAEGGARCQACFRRVLGRAAVAAKQFDCATFTTSLTVSPHKHSATIFAIGAAFPGFEAIDFKKKDGFRRSLELTRQLGFYRQNYCGCEFSRRSD